MIIIYFLLIFLFSFLLVKGADLTIKYLTKIGQFLKLGPFFLSFIFVAITTSLPEISVAIVSSFHKVSNLSLGNVIGANIINLTLILGLYAIIAKGIGFRKTTKIETFASLLASFLPVFLALDGKLSRTDGLVLIFLFIIYLFFIFLKEKRHFQRISSEREKDIYKNFFFLICGLILLVGSAEIIVKIAQILAINLKLPLILIGLILISLGTTLPELTFGLRAVLKKQSELSLGDSLGTIVVNSCLGLGLAALIFPIEIVAFSTFFLSAFFFLSAIIIFAFFIETNNKLSQTEGIFLVLFFIIFLIVQLLFSR